GREISLVGLWVGVLKTVVDAAIVETGAAGDISSHRYVIATVIGVRIWTIPDDVPLAVCRQRSSAGKLYRKDQFLRSAQIRLGDRNGLKVHLLYCRCVWRVVTWILRHSYAGQDTRSLQRCWI